jgi:hypothetical protein
MATTQGSEAPASGSLRWPRPNRSSSRQARWLVHRRSGPHLRSRPPRRSKRSVASCLRLQPTRRESPGRLAVAPSAARASVRRSPCRITAPGSRPSKRCFARDSGELARPRSLSRGCSLSGRDRRSELERDEVIFAISYAQAIQAYVDRGEDALRSELERWEPEARATVARALAEVA